MSLQFALHVNGECVGHLGARNVDGTTDPDSVGNYDVEVTTYPTGGFRQHWRESVSHRFGDGAWALVRKAIEQMERAQS